MNPASPSPPHRPKRIKAAFLGPFAAAIGLIMAVFAGALYLMEAKVRDRDLAERAQAVAKLFAVKLDKDGNLMRAVVHAMRGNPAIVEAFRRGDRAALERSARPLFDALRRDHRITHLYFTGPDRINLYRLHTPADFGDRIDRATMLQTHSRKEPVHGLELGPLGTLTLRTVVPWREAGRSLGYVELGEEVKHLIDEIRDNLAVDLLVLVDKRYLAQDQWQRGQALMQRQGEWERFPSHVILAQTRPSLPAGLDPPAFARLLNGGSVRISEGGRSLHMALVPLADAAGHPIGKLAVLRDVTELEATFTGYMAAVIALSLALATGVLGVFHVALQRVEKDYQRQHELEHRLLHLDTEHQRILQVEKLSALGTMVGSIAHQLNNPLVGVVNMAQLADREADDPRRARALLAEIRHAGEDCRGFVKRMLEFSKVSCFESKPTAMAPLIEDTVLMFRQAEPHHLPVKLELPTEPPLLTLDPILIRHALFNLLLNAAQATEGQAPITLRLEPATDAASGRAGWTLSVADGGRGIAPEVLDKIFVPFFTTRADGTGLGLPVVLHVALLHDGHVTATNRPEGGACFALWLPQ
ncbi:MAG: histidine kinase [Rhodocyclales bacterium]|nr:histidine kinase [Rhodocyclales bacterium]